MKRQYWVLLSVFFLFSCSPNNVKKDPGLKKFFDEHQLDGCFALFENATGKFTVYNFSRYRDSSYLPASTFKIVNSLIGLQTGRISSDSMVIPWDGVQRKVPEWNRDLNMYQAFRVSSVPYYQEVARRIGKDTMQFWLDSLEYGLGSDTDKVVIRSPIDTFWLDNSLKVRPDQQLGLMKLLYFNKLPFFKNYQETVKRAMLFDNNTNYQLSYKTGWGITDRNHALGWVVGWIEENEHPFFFVLNVESTDPGYDMSTVRLKILTDILKHLGLMQGRK
jgi:beta-lactamase class D